MRLSVASPSMVWSERSSVQKMPLNALSAPHQLWWGDSTVDVSSAQHAPGGVEHTQPLLVVTRQCCRVLDVTSCRTVFSAASASIIHPVCFCHSTDEKNSSVFPAPPQVCFQAVVLMPVHRTVKVSSLRSPGVPGELSHGRPAVAGCKQGGCQCSAWHQSLSGVVSNLDPGQGPCLAL